MFTTTDLLVCLGYFVAVVATGFLAARRQRASVAGYFRADNQLPWYVIGFSIVAAGISSEQFVGEAGYAYKLGMPVVNWEWLVFPALSILLWIFIPLYVRHRITTMPEYLEHRFGPRARTFFAVLTVASYVLINFALVFYTGGFAIERMWGLDRVAAVWILAAITGAYTVYGGLRAVAWTGSLQCVLLLGGGLYVFFAGLAQIGWDFRAVLGEGQRARLFTPADHEVPWTALTILMLSTNVWYYATNQYINQRCLAARNEWHARMGVLFSAFLQLLIPLATCFPGMIYRVINPNLDNPDAAYPAVVAAVVPEGWRGLVVAAVLSAIMSTVSGLVNSTSTLVTLDLVGRMKGRRWSEAQLVRVGRWSGAGALLVGALLAPIVMRWDNIFRYAQDLWAPMAAPIVIVFLAGALWEPATERGAVACLWLSILSVPFILGKTLLADFGVHFLPANLENPMVFAGAYGLCALAVMIGLSRATPHEPTLTPALSRPTGEGAPANAGAGEGKSGRSTGAEQVRNEQGGLRGVALLPSAGAVVVILWLGARSPVAIAALWITAIGWLAWAMLDRRQPRPHLWDHSMLRLPERGPWYAGLAVWWLVLAAILAALYVTFW